MSPPAGQGASRRGEQRVSFESSVRLRYRLFQEFLSENAENISPGGMFIRTRQPGEPGEELDFEIALEDDFTLVSGRGRVMWARREPAGPEAPPGMGIRFVELPEESRALVDKIVAERVKEGGELFDPGDQAPPADAEPSRVVVTPPLDEAAGEVFQLDSAPAEPASEEQTGEAGQASASSLPAPAPAASPAGLDPESPPADRPDPGTSPATSPVAAPAPGLASSLAVGEILGPAASEAPGGSKPLRLVVVAILSALAGAAAVLTFQRLYVAPSIEQLEIPIEELAGSPGGPWQPPAAEPAEPVAPAPAAAVTDDGNAGAPATEDSTALRPTEIVDTLRGWAGAWSRQRPDDYLSFYAAGFEPPDGLDRAAWEEARRLRIDSPQWIRVALTLVEVEETGPGMAEVRLVQSYRSERYKDLVRKRLRMVREGGEWKIAAERVVR